MLYKLLFLISTLIALTSVSFVYTTNSMLALLAVEAFALCVASYSFVHTNWYVR